MKTKSYISGILAIAILMFVGLACNQYGEKLEFNGGELYYTKNVTEANFLVLEGNPLEDFNQIKKIRMRFKQGSFIETGK